MKRSDLHEYQVRAVDFIKTHTHCALLLDMGLGKSVSTLTAINDLINDSEVERVLIIAPRTVAESTWASECEKWEHLKYLRVSRVIGNEKQRLKALEEKADIYVMGRDNVVWLVKHYRAKIPFDVIVLDELTSFKSNKSQRFKALKLIRTQPNRIIGLTGTPAPNGYKDLWAQMYCLDGGKRLGAYITHYMNNYFSQVMSPYGYAIKTTLVPGAKEKIEERISDICISMKSEDYLTLPDRQDIVQKVELPPSVMKRYREFEKEQVLETKNAEITAASAAALMNKLSQFSNGAVYDADGQAHHIHDHKLEHLEEIVEQAGSPVLVFYQFKSDIPRITEALSKGYKVVQYNNDDDLKAWNEGKIDVLLAHPASTAYGLNMQQGGHIVVWYGTGWNLELYQQANARLYRQGQKYPVLIYNLVCKGTVDERALMVLQGKMSAQEGLLRAVKELTKKYGV